MTLQSSYPVGSETSTTCRFGSNAAAHEKAAAAGKTEPVVIHHGREERPHQMRHTQLR